MRIGFDAKRIFHNFTGLGNYSRDLLNGLVTHYPEEEYHLFTPSISTNPRIQAFTDAAHYHVHTSSGTWSSIWRILGIPSAAKKAGIDIFHGLSNEIPAGLQKKEIKSIVTIHDLIFLRYPEQYQAIDRFIYKRKCQYACRNSDRIIAVSKHTKSDIIDYFKTDPQKIEVIPPICDKQFYKLLSKEAQDSVRISHQLPENYALYVGSIIPRKNLLNIVKAIHLLGREDRLPLVVMGKGKAYLQEVKKYIQEHRLEDWIVFPKNVPFEDFPAIYQRAEMLIFPALYEGFGLPLLEANWSRIPVISSRKSSLPEVAGPDGYYIDPHDPESIAEAIKTILHHPEDVHKRVASGFAHAQQFHEKILTTRLMQLYRHLIEQGTT